MSCFRMGSDLSSCHFTYTHTNTHELVHTPHSQWLNGFFHLHLAMDYGLWIISEKTEGEMVKEWKRDVFHGLTVNINAIFYWAFYIFTPIYLLLLYRRVHLSLAKRQHWYLCMLFTWTHLIIYWKPEEKLREMLQTPLQDFFCFKKDTNRPQFDAFSQQTGFTPLQ